jgi:O-antigen/teichoic acid export membrane protein
MSRFRNAARSLTSGYAALIANGFYLLASIPLALRYLSADEFALWNVVVQIAGYLTLIDFGMTGAVARILIDHKDDRQAGKYGPVIKTGILGLLIQGLCIILGGLLLALILPALLDVPHPLKRIFEILIAGQCGLLGSLFVTRIFMSLLQAHQRFDVMNYAQILQLIAGFATQWITFHLGWGLYSLLAAGAVNAVVGAAYNCFWVLKLQLFPSESSWGKANAKLFQELFAFGKDLFLLSIGLQLLNATQVVIIARTLGWTAVTVWTIATKTFLLAQQIVARISDFSSSALGEMVVRGEQERLQRRFRELLVVTAAVAVFVGASIALCNGSFIAVWLKGGAHTIAVADLKKLPLFVSKLKAQETPVSRFLSSQLSIATQEAIRTNTNPEILRGPLVSELNEIIRTQSLYDPDHFRAISLSTETRSLVDRKLRGGWLARLNRLLLEDAFPNEIEQSIRFSSAWPWRNDVLLGLLLIVTSVTRCNISLTGQTKQIGGMRFVYFLEGIFFVTTACLVAPRWGMSGIIIASILANVLWSGAYGFWRSARYFCTRVSELLFLWLRPAYRYLLLIVPVTVGLAWATSGLFVRERFLLCSAALLVIGSALLWVGGLTRELRLEFKERFKLFNLLKAGKQSG